MQYIYHYYVSLRNWFIDKQIESTDDIVKKSKLKLAFNVYLLFSIISLLYIPYLATTTLNVQFYLALVTLFVNGTLLLGLKYFDSLKWGGAIHIITLFTTVIFQIYYSQGYINFVTVSWFTVAAIFAFFQYGRKAGTAVVAASLLLISIFILMKVNDYPFPEYAIDINTYYAGVFISLSLVFAFIYMMVDRFTKYNDEMIKNISASENRLSTIVENLPAGAVYLFNNKLFFNKEFIKLSGYTTHEIKSIDELMKHIFSTNIEKEKLKFLALQQSESISEDNIIHIVSKSNSIKTVEVSFQRGHNYEIVLFKDITTLKSKEKELDESTYFVDNLAKAIPHIIFLFDLKKKKNIYVNEALYTISGYSPKELINKSIVDFLHADDIEKVKRHIEHFSSIKSDDLSELEYRIKAANGKYIWLRSIHKVFKRNDNGEPTIAIGIAENITDKKNAEIKYKDLTERLLLATNAVNFGVWDWDLETNEFYWDDAMYKLFDATRKKYPNPVDAFQDRVHPEDYEIAWIGIEEAYKRNEQFESTFRIILPTEKIKYITVIYKVFKDDEGIPYRVMGVNHDVTESKEREILQLKNQRLTNIINSDGNLLFTSNDFTGAIGLFLNNTGNALDVDEISIYEIDQNNIPKLYYYWDKKRHNHNASNDYKDSNDSKITELIQLQNSNIEDNGIVKIYNNHTQFGNIVTALDLDSLTFSSIYILGKYWGIFVIKNFKKQNNTEPFDEDIIRSITNTIGGAIAQKIHKEELTVEKEKAELASKAKTIFLASVSHEIRTPLNAINGLTKLLIEDSSAKTLTEKLKLLQFSVDNLTFLMNDILDFSKIESGKSILENKVFTLKKLVEEIVTANNYLAEKKQLQLKYEIDRNIPATLLGDAVKLSHIINNLLSIAVRNTDKGYVNLSLNFEKKIKNDTLIAFSISFSGKDNIQTLPSVSEKNNTDSNDVAHSELSIVITSKIIDFLGGKLIIEHPSVNETIYGFKLLFKNKNDDTTVSPAKSNQYNFTGLKFLLAEDNEINALIAIKFLTSWGATVVHVTNGKDAIKKIEAENFDMILLDMFMPELDGYTTATRIRALNEIKKANTPIIAITASALDEVFDVIFKSGINDYVTKPFSPLELNDKIKKHLIIN